MASQASPRPIYASQPYQWDSPTVGFQSQSSTPSPQRPADPTNTSVLASYPRPNQYASATLTGAPQPSSPLRISTSAQPDTRGLPLTQGMSPQSRPTDANNQTHHHTRSSSFFSFRKSHAHTPSESSSQTSSQVPLQNVPQHQNMPPQTMQMMNGNDTQRNQPLASQHSQIQGPSIVSPENNTIQTMVTQQRQPQTQQQDTITAGHQSPQPMQSPPSLPQGPQLHPEIRSVVQLTMAHSHKIYYSGPLVRRIERQPDGQKPSKDEGWIDVWAQLGGTTLSVWDMKQVQEASKQGKEVPPTYVNMTDAFVQVLNSITIPATPTSPAKRYPNILAVNTAGSNLLLFSCPTQDALLAWTAALRLSSWEKSRLEELYTAHLIRITLNARDLPSTLVRGRMDGWVRVRVAGQTDWKRLWMVIQAGSGEATHNERPSSGGSSSPINTLTKKRRMSNLFSRDHSPSAAAGPAKSVISMYISQKPKDRKKALLTMQDVTQAFAVYPERPELISRSTLIKVEGRFGDEELARDMRQREGWTLIMPELEGGQNQVGEMLKWTVALHDVFRLHGRPGGWTWDPRDAASMMFGYPIGPQKELLFLDREAAETLDPRDDRTSVVRSGFQRLLYERMQTAGTIKAVQPEQQQQQPQAQLQEQEQEQPDAAPGLGPQLPPLSFGEINLQKSQLAPITEGSGVNTLNRLTSVTSIDAPNTMSSVQFPNRAISTVSNASSNVLERTTSPQSPDPATNSQIRQAQPSVTSRAPPSAASSFAQISSPPTSAKGKNREGSLARSSPASSFDKSQPLPAIASKSALDDRPRSRSSILTSPHSITEKHIQDDSGYSPSTNHSFDRLSVLTSPYSPATTARRELPSMSNQLSTPAGKVQHSAPSDDVHHNLFNEAGAMYYVANVEGDQSKQQPPRRIPTTISERDDTSSSGSAHQTALAQSSSPATSPATASLSPSIPSIPSIHLTSSSSPKAPEILRPTPTRQSTPMAFVERTATSVPADRLSPKLRPGLGRKPSGAREQGTGRLYNDGISSSKTLAEEDSDTDESMEESQSHSKIPARKTQFLPSGPTEDSNLDVLAALSYLDVNDDQPTLHPTSKSVEPLKIRSAEKIAPSPPPEMAPSSQLAPAAMQPTSNEPVTQYKSSFTLSKQAVERKAKAQAQQIAHHAAVHKPGRSNGKRKSRVADAWNESSDEEEEEEEEEEDDEADSDDNNIPSSRQHTPSSGPASSNASVKPPNNQSLGAQYGELDHNSQSNLRPHRTLPQVPGNRPHGEDSHIPPTRRLVSEQYFDVNRRTHFDDGPQIRSQAEFPQPGTAQKSLWSQVLDPGRASGQIPDPHARDTFIRLEPPSETMTKAFTPQGLLSAGLQDKQDRSAKRQEELARETGASLINVPNKPPPPQTGLLGAITAHERERKRDGGVGAALTEREREKRLVEERQRRFDEQQRQQLEQMQQGGSMYGQYPGFNPMVNPMMMGMMGMNPMMTGGMAPMMTGGMAPMMTGYPGMMPGLNPQHLYAAQQAATQAYQQAMMAFSTAGSQVGGENGAGTQPLAPNMTGNMGVMGGYDPRMSMMGMGMMNPLGMHMTGMSTFDPRFSMAGNAGPMGDMGLQPPGPIGGQSPGNIGSRNSSPARPSEPQGEIARGSRPTTPRS
ncbi:hypothetical protein AX17_002274 [Amanita inopinata Kibby_2008]|nr:hypothetical protein AX17_002274 [Amanita inopinata Kibby_2008]